MPQRPTTLASRSALRLGFVMTLVLVLFTASTLAQLNPGRVQGTVKLEDGTPLGNVVLHFEPVATSSRAPRDVKVKKKGKFFVPIFPGGTYTLTMKGDEYYVKHFKYSAKEPSGRTMNEYDTAGHPEKGVEGVRIMGGARMFFEVTAGTAKEKRAAIQAVAMGEVGDELKQISELFSARNFDAVIAETTKVLEKKPELGPAYYLKGVALFYKNQHAEAKPVLDKALELVPDQEGIQGVYGSVMLELAKKDAELARDAKAKKEFSIAADAFAKELEADPTNLAILTNRIVALNGAGRTDDLKPALEALIAADPNNVTAYFQLASYYQKKGDTAAALEALGKLPEGDKSAAPAMYNIAVSRYNEKDYATAKLALEKALSMDPGFSQAYYLLGYVCLGSGEQPAAIEALKKFVEVAPDSPKAAETKDLVQRLEAAQKK